MYIKRIIIENYKGIKHMDYVFRKGINCLVGPGDATKSTILKAISIALTSNRTIYISDNDFYNMDPKNEITIKITIGDVPKELLTEDNFGLYICKFVEGDEDDEPKDNDEKFIIIQLTISMYYELEWKVVNNRKMYKTIGPNDRKKIKVGIVGERFDKDFNLGRNSNLSNYYEDSEEIKRIILDVYRQTNNKKISKNSNIDKLIMEVSMVQREYGINKYDNLNLKFNIKNDFSTSDLEIFNGKIPVSLDGIGSRRLFSSILNLSTKSEESIILIDEIEYGLEPYRLMKLLRVLRNRKKESQVIMTSHSPVTMIQLESEELIICRSNKGITKCISPNIDMKPLLRAVPEAVLSKKVLLLEGRTEYGVIESLNSFWSSIQEGIEYFGVAKVNAESDSKACSYAKQLVDLGYDVAVLLDSDNATIEHQIEELTKLNVKVIRWKDNMAIEERILMDLPEKKIVELINVLKEENDIENIKLELGEKYFDISDNFIATSLNYEERILLGKTIKKKKWMKNIEMGKKVGNIIVESISNEEIKNTDLLNKIDMLRRWCYGC